MSDEEIMILVGAAFVCLLIVGIVISISRSIFMRRIGILQTASNKRLDSSQLEKELNRVDVLKQNLVVAKQNLSKLEVPVPAPSTNYDDVGTSISKLTEFTEKHKYAVVATEQAILSILPISQIGQSLQSIVEVAPANICSQIFGGAVSSIKDGFVNLPTHAGLDKFLHGMTHLSQHQIHSITMSCHGGDVASIITTPLKNGLMEAVNVHDAGHQMLASIKDVSADIASSLKDSVALTDLTSATHFDISGHIPYVTIALSSYREIQLLSDNKTNVFSSVKNVALDATGTGVGAMGGAKVGAIAGAAFGPAGAIVGGIIGAVAGGIGGRSITDKIKRRPLKKAIERYNSSSEQMKMETQIKSRDTLSEIYGFSGSKRNEFLSSELRNKIPILDGEAVIKSVAVGLVQFMINEVARMEMIKSKTKNSIWYSRKKYDSVINDFDARLVGIKKSLPSADCIKHNPRLCIEKICRMNIPVQSLHNSMQLRIGMFTSQLKSANDKNDAAVLMWSYMVSRYHQKIMSDIATYSNEQMNSLNTIFANWRTTMDNLSAKVEREKSKLGIA